MNNDPRRKDAKSPTPGEERGVDIDEFADRFERQWNATVGTRKEASALDPALWNQIRDDVRPRKPRMSRRRRGVSPVAMKPGQQVRDAHLAPNVPPEIPPTQWHRGLFLFAAVILVGSLVVLMPGGSISPRQGSIVREAPQIVTPIPSQEAGCDVVPLTREEVLAIVLDPEGRGFADDRSLFATPPPEPSGYAHTQTWLPESNGFVEMAGGPRPVRMPTAPEFQEAKSALDRYMRCQSEGTNFQLWALESPVEVQRQVLVLTHALHPEGAQAGSSRSVDDLTETRLLQTIDEVGPDLRSANNFNVYMFFHEEFRLFDVESNPDRGAALVADNTETGEVEYAWIALQWVDPDTGEVISTRGASLDATPVSPDGTTPNLVVMILRLDAATGSWLVEWFVPTI